MVEETYCYALLYVGSNCKQLQQLLMADAKRVEDSGLIAVSSGCSSLEVLGKLCYSILFCAILCYSMLYYAMGGSYMLTFPSIYSVVVAAATMQCSAVHYVQTNL